jgi:hypothetical protein
MQEGTTDGRLLFGKCLRFLNLRLLISGSANAYADVTIAFENIEDSGSGAGHPESFYRIDIFLNQPEILRATMRTVHDDLTQDRFSFRSALWLPRQSYNGSRFLAKIQVTYQWGSL